MLYDARNAPQISFGKFCAAQAAINRWRPDREEIDAAFDYAIDSAARGTGGPRHIRRAGLGGDWNADREIRWFVIDQRAG